MKRVILNIIILLPTIGLVISCENGNQKKKHITVSQAHSIYPKSINDDGSIKNDGFYMLKKDYHDGILKNNKDNYISMNGEDDSMFFYIMKMI